MAAGLLPQGKQQFLDGEGIPLAGGTVAFFVPGTTTAKQTWADSLKSVLNANPLTLDSAGRAVIYGTGVYRQIVKDASGNLIYDQPVAAPFADLPSPSPDQAKYVVRISSDGSTYELQPIATALNGNMTGDTSWNGRKITSLGNGTSGGDALNITTGDGRYIAASGEARDWATSGSVTASKFQLDAAFYVTLSGGSPFISSATGAWYKYDRTAGQHQWAVGAINQLIAGSGYVAPGVDFGVSLGLSSNRWTSVYATTFQLDAAFYVTQVGGNPYISVANGAWYQFDRTAGQHQWAVGAIVRLVVGASYAAPGVDNGVSLGLSGSRWTVVYATTGSINTSDRDTKVERDLSEAVLRAVYRVPLRAYALKDSLTEKGDAARTHYGYFAQDVATELIAEGIDPATQAFWCEDTLTEGIKRQGLRYEEFLSVRHEAERRVRLATLSL